GDDLAGAGHPLGGAAQGGRDDWPRRGGRCRWRGGGRGGSGRRGGRGGRGGGSPGGRGRRGPCAGGRGAAAGGGGGGAGAGRGGGGGCRLADGPRGLEHILLADAAADPGAGYGGEIHAVLGGQLADERGDVGTVGRRRQWYRGGGFRLGGRCRCRGRRRGGFRCRGCWRRGG